MKIAIIIILAALFTLNQRRSLPAQEPAAWCIVWARDYAVTGLEARFTAHRVPYKSLGDDPAATLVRESPKTKRSGEILRGHWRFTLAPIGRQYIEFDKVINGKIERLEKASWDEETGEGRSFLHKSDSVQGSGVIYLKRPQSMGSVLLPSNPAFFSYGGRSLSRYWDSARTEVRELESDLYAVYCIDSTMAVYLLDRTRQFPIVEQRIYMKPDSAVPEEVRHLHTRKQLGREIELPEEFRGGVFFSNKIVLETREISGYWIPVRWAVFQCLSKEGPVVIELDPDAIRVNPAPQPEDYQITFPPGTAIHDASRGIGYTVGPAGEVVNAEVMAESSLDAILEDAGYKARANSGDRAVSRATGCGANVLYGALAILGRPASYSRLLDSLGIREEHTDCTFADLIEVAAELGEESIAVRGGRDMLKIAAIAPMVLHKSPDERSAGGPVSSAGADHFYLICDHDERTDTVQVIDPPLLPYRASVKLLEEDAWSGNAIIFSRNGIAAFESLAKRRMLGNILGVSAVLLCLGLAVGLLRRRKSR